MLSHAIAPGTSTRFSIFRRILSGLLDADRIHVGSPVPDGWIRIQLPLLDLVGRIGLLFRRDYTRFRSPVAATGLAAVGACSCGLRSRGDAGRVYGRPWASPQSISVRSNQRRYHRLHRAHTHQCDRGYRTEFLIDIGGGVRIKAGQRYAISVGYKLVHVSNGGTTRVNPGLDNNVFFAGFSILK